MNPTIKAFSAPIKIVFHSFCKLTSSIFNSICHRACPCNLVVIWQVLTDEEKGPCYGRAVLGRQTAAAGSQPAHLHMLAVSSISSSHQSTPLHKPQRGMLCQPPAWQLAVSWPCPLGNLFCEACGNMETQKQESRSPKRMCLSLLMKRVPDSHMTQCCMSGAGWQQQALRGGYKSPLQMALMEGAASWARPGAVLCSTTSHAHKAGHGVPDVMRLAGCTSTSSL